MSRYNYTAKVNHYRQVIEIVGMSTVLLVSLKEAKEIYEKLGPAIKELEVGAAPTKKEVEK